MRIPARLDRDNPRSPLAFVRERRGAVMMELAFAMPIVMVLILGSYDTASFILLHQKLNRAATTMTDLVSRPASITPPEVDPLFAAAQKVMEPFPLGDRGIVIVSYIEREEDDVARVLWQRVGGGALSQNSQIGLPGQEADMPAGFVVRETETLVATEIYYDYEPTLLSWLLEPGIQRQDSYRRPRLGAIN